MHTLVILQSATLDRLFERMRVLLEGSGTALIEFFLALIVVMAGTIVATLIGKIVLLMLRAARFNDGMRRVVGPGALRHEPAAIAAWAAHWTVVAHRDRTHFLLTTAHRLADIVQQAILDEITRG